MRIIVVYGGLSAERQSSINTGNAVFSSLVTLNYDVRLFDFKNNTYEFIELIRQFSPDLVYNALHGGIGENGTMQGLLDMLGIAYIGSGVLANAISLNKYMTKLLLKGAGYDVPKGILLRKNSSLDYSKIVEKNKVMFPLIVKPNSQGSKLGIKLAKNYDEMVLAIDEAFFIDNEIILEEYIEGQEYAVSLVELNQKLTMLPVVAIDHIDNTSDYMSNEKSKYRMIDKELSLINVLNETCLGIFDLFDMKDFARFDIIVSE